MAETVSLRVTLRYRDVEEFSQRFAENISSAGLFLRTRTPKLTGTRIRFELSLADGRKVLKGEGVVVQVRHDATPGMALRFSEIDEESLAIVQRVVERYGQGPLAPTPLPASLAGNTAQGGLRSGKSSTAWPRPVTGRLTARFGEPRPSPTSEPEPKPSDGTRGSEDPGARPRVPPRRRDSGSRPWALDDVTERIDLATAEAVRTRAAETVAAPTVFEPPKSAPAPEPTPTSGPATAAEAEHVEGAPERRTHEPDSEGSDRKVSAEATLEPATREETPTREEIEDPTPLNEAAEVVDEAADTLRPVDIPERLAEAEAEVPVTGRSFGSLPTISDAPLSDAPFAAPSGLTPAEPLTFGDTVEVPPEALGYPADTARPEPLDFSQTETEDVSTAIALARRAASAVAQESPESSAETIEPSSIPLPPESETAESARETVEASSIDSDTNSTAPEDSSTVEGSAESEFQETTQPREGEPSDKADSSDSTPDAEFNERTQPLEERLDDRSEPSPPTPEATHDAARAERGAESESEPGPTPSRIETAAARPGSDSSDDPFAETSLGEDFDAQLISAAPEGRTEVVASIAPPPFAPSAEGKLEDDSGFEAGGDSLEMYSAHLDAALGGAPLDAIDLGAVAGELAARAAAEDARGEEAWSRATNEGLTEVATASAPDPRAVPKDSWPLGEGALAQSWSALVPGETGDILPPSVRTVPYEVREIPAGDAVAVTAPEPEPSGPRSDRDDGAQLTRGSGESAEPARTDRSPEKADLGAQAAAPSAVGEPARRLQAPSAPFAAISAHFAAPGRTESDGAPGLLRPPQFASESATVLDTESPLAPRPRQKAFESEGVTQPELSAKVEPDQLDLRTQVIRERKLRTATPLVREPTPLGTESGEGASGTPVPAVSTPSAPASPRPSYQPPPLRNRGIVERASQPAAAPKPAPQRLAGVDFGSRWIRVASYDGSAKLLHIEGADRFPSVVAARLDGALVSGSEAVVILGNDPSRAVFPRNILSAMRNGRVEHALITRPKGVAAPEIEVSDGRIAVTLAGYSFELEQLLTVLFQPVRHALSSVLGSERPRVLVAVPDGLEDSTKALLARSLGAAGLELERWVSELDAALEAYEIDRRPVDTVVLVDLGASHLGLALARRGRSGFGHLGSLWVPEISAQTYDDALVELLLAEVARHDGSDRARDPAVRQRLAEALSRSRPDHRDGRIEVTLTLPAGGASGVSVQRTLTLSGQRVESALEGQVKRTLDRVLELLRESGVHPRALGTIVLAGSAASHRSLVKSLIQATGRTPLESIQPSDVFALGLAAIGARLVSGTAPPAPAPLAAPPPLAPAHPKASSPTLARSVGIVLPGGRVLRLFPVGSPLPKKIERVHATTRDDQADLDVVFCQGEDEFVSGCVPVGKVALDDLPKGKRGTVEVRLEIEIDAEGVLQATLSEESSGRKIRFLTATAQTPESRRRDLGQKPVFEDLSDKSRPRTKSLFGRLFGR
ncbi:MAG: TIGR02266 family protein [Deltaproteobacteria bacterium]|nr:TIGR02266 family protein [Deltaproteobacteria bacterium]